MSEYLPLIAGGCLLLFGRRLFWLLIGVAGFGLGLYFAQNALELEARGVELVLALAAGALAAFLAVFFQKAALAAAGFVVGGYAAYALLVERFSEGNTVLWIAVVAAAVVGAMLARLVFELAVVLVSSVAGAVLVLRAPQLVGLPHELLFLGLVAVGVVVQLVDWRRDRSRK